MISRPLVNRRWQTEGFSQVRWMLRVAGGVSHIRCLGDLNVGPSALLHALDGGTSLTDDQADLLQVKGSVERLRSVAITTTAAEGSAASGAWGI